MVRAEAVNRRYQLENLGCPGCAEKIRAEVARMDGVVAAEIDFAAQSLSLQVNHSAAANLTEAIRTAARRHEPDIEVRDCAGEENPDPGVLGEEAPGPWYKRFRRRTWMLGVLPFVAGLLLPLPDTARMWVYLAAYLLSGGGVLWRAARNLARGRVFDEHFLMSVATLGALWLGEYPEGVAVMLFYQLGEALQSMAVDRSRRSVGALARLRPEYATLLTNSGPTRVKPESVRAGQYITVAPGERVPLDGVVREGRSALDTAALTGESMPREAQPGVEVLSGSVNLTGVLIIEVTAPYGESTAARLVRLTQEAGARKASAERLMTRLARRYTPIVVVGALLLALLPPLILPGEDWQEWLRRALVFLVISCPCALVISIPLCFFCGMGRASKEGVLIKGGRFLETLAAPSVIVFDKTGTLTTGHMAVTEVNPASGFSKTSLLTLAARAERYSAHPAAPAIRAAAGLAKDETDMDAKDFEDITGLGVRAVVDGTEVLVGRARLLETYGVSIGPNAPEGAVLVAAGGRYAGCLRLSDELKPGGREMMNALRALGAGTLAMLTGDSVPAAEPVARELGLDSYAAGLLPHEKVAGLERLVKDIKRGNIIFVGDGVNDAPVLARADAGVSMGGLGSDAAIEASDVVLMGDDPRALVRAVRIARKTRRIAWQNITLALGIKAALLALGALGLASMWSAVFGDVGVTLLAVLNAARIAGRRV